MQSTLVLHVNSSELRLSNQSKQRHKLNESKIILKKINFFNRNFLDLYTILLLVTNFRQV